MPTLHRTCPWLLVAVGLASFVSMASAPPSGPGLNRRQGKTSDAFEVITSTYVETDLKTITTVFSSYPSTPTAIPSQPAGGCAVPCGYQGQLCCAPNEVCYTDASSQAQCSAPASVTPSCLGWSTSVYTSSSSYTTTIVETIVLTLSRIETGVETCVRTASWQVAPATCVTELGQQQCGNICCLPNQSCQSPGLCTSTCSSGPPTQSTGCQYSLGESLCGSVCCQSGQYCQQANMCVAAAAGSSDSTSPYTASTVTLITTTESFEVETPSEMSAEIRIATSA